MMIYIDDKECACEKGEYIMHIAERNDIFIPRFCHHTGLPEQACCRVCIVEIETQAGGSRQVVTSCVYPVEREIRVYTGSEKIKKQRAMVLALLSARAPDSDRAAALIQVSGGEVPQRFIRLNGEKCILCGLCAKACNNLGAGAISTVGRGTAKKVSTPYEAPSQTCVGCGSCAVVCPTGAIELTQDEDTRTIWDKTFTLLKCDSCGAIIGTPEEILLAEQRLSAQDKSRPQTSEAQAAEADTANPGKLCETCRKKKIAGIFAATYGK